MLKHMLALQLTKVEITKEIQHLARRRHRRKLIKKGIIKPYQ